MLKNSSDELSAKDILEVELNLGISLPKKFLHFYMEENGGIPYESYFYMENFDTFTEVSCFIPIKFPGELGNGTIEDVYTNFTRVKNTLPKKFLPFARDWGGNLFCINLDNDDVNLIYLDLGVVNEDNGSIRFLANSFDIFLKSLEETGDD